MNDTCLRKKGQRLGGTILAQNSSNTAIRSLYPIVLFFLHYLKALLCCWYCCEIVSSNPVVVYFPLYASLLVWYNIVELPIKSANNLQTQAYDDDPTNNAYGILKPYDLRFDVIYPKWVVLIKDQTCGGAWAIIRQWAPIKPKGTLIDHILWSSP